MALRPECQLRRVVAREAHAEWRSWYVEQLECGHGLVRQGGNRRERRVCRLCAMLSGKR